MTTNSAGAHKGTTELRFATSLGTPVEGLRYRLSDGQGNVWTGSTGQGGLGVTIVEAAPDRKSSTSTVWHLDDEAQIRVEMQRDDGSWKTIGTFSHGAGLHRQVDVIAGAIAMPFQMAAV